MNEQIDDKAFENYLGRRGPVSQRYRELEASDVPLELDRLVIERATQAVEKKQQRPAWRTWAIPVALAASTVLAIAVVIESGVTPTPAVQEEVSSLSLAPAEAPAVEEKATSVESQAPVSLAVDLPPPAPVAPVPVAPATPPTLAADRSAELRAAEARQRAQQAASERQRAVDTREHEPVAVSGARPSEVQAMRAPVTAERDDAASGSAEPQGAVASRSEASPPSAVALDEIAVTAQRRVQRGFGPRGTVRPATDEDWADAEEQRRQSDPALWLEHIRELRRERKHEEADREWSEFRKTFPDYSVAETDAARPQR